MKSILDPFRKWFGYSRRERSYSLILLLIVMVMIFVRLSMSERDTAYSVLYLAPPINKSTSGVIEAEEKRFTSVCYFDPNTASFDTLIDLGLDEKQARTLISYRSKGGRFTVPADIRKVYGIDDKLADRLIPLIRIDNFAKHNQLSDLSVQKNKLIELNSCDTSELKSLPGIGPVLSARIIKYRHLLGGFVSVDQLKEVYGLSEETFTQIEKRVYTDSVAISRIRINSGEFSDLIRFPYFEKYEVTSIIKYRELEGRIEALSDLIVNRILTPEKAAKIGPYLSFE